MGQPLPQTGGGQEGGGLRPRPAPGRGLPNGRVPLVWLDHHGSHAFWASD